MIKKHKQKHSPKEEISEEKQHHFVRKSLHKNTKKEELEEIDEIEEIDEESEEHDDIEEEHEESEHIHRTKKQQKEIEEEDFDDDYEENELPSSARVNEQLSQIYKNKDGSLPDMTFFQKKERVKVVRAFFTLLFSCLFLLAVVSGGMYFFRSNQNFSAKGVMVSVTGEDDVAAGELMHYRIRYRNDEKIPLAKSKIVLYYPEGFQFKESNVPSSNDKHDEWDLGTLEAGQSGYIDVYGVLYGSIGTERSFRVFLNYTPSNFNSEFQSAGVGKIRITESPVALSITAPSSSVAGQVLPLLFTVTPRTASSSLKNLALVIESSDGFIKKSSDPQSDNFSDLSWTIPVLNSEKSILVNAAISLPAGVKEYDLKAKIVGWTDDARQGSGFVLTEKSSVITFEESQFSVDFSINGTANNFSISPSEVLKPVIRIHNNAATAISNIRASVSFEAPSFENKSILDWAVLDDKNKNTISGEQMGPDIRRGVVSWDKSQIAGLSSLSPKGEIPIEFSLPLKARDKISYTSFKESKIRATLEVQYELAGKKQVAVVGPIEITINSDIAVTSRKTGKDLSDGKKQYTFFWDLRNSFHEVKNVEISAEIFGDVLWDEKLQKAPFGNANFDAASKKLTWKIDTLPASAGVQTLQFGFVRKSFNPSQVLMMSKIKVIGKDVVTGKDLILLESEIPNEL